CAPDAIGSQAHVAGWYTDQEFATMLNELAEAGLPLQITEFWAHAKDNPFKDEMDEATAEKALIDHVTMIYSLAFAHPQVNHLTYWGGREWFDENGNATNLYFTLKKLIKEKWTTNVSLIADANGEILVPAFFGEYALEISDQQGNKRYQSFSFAKNDPIKNFVF
ncbi:MAG: endo-1,4-beta-xylanase, partial [Cyclobacteriaceae bacterium]